MCREGLGSPGIQPDMKRSRFCSWFLYSAGGAVRCLRHRCLNTSTEGVCGEENSGVRSLFATISVYVMFVSNSCITASASLKAVHGNNLSFKPAVPQPFFISQTGFLLEVWRINTAK